MPEKFLHAEFLSTPSVQFFNGRLQEQRNCTETKKILQQKVYQRERKWLEMANFISYIKVCLHTALC